MELGIIGLPGCGKTTVFNALTRGEAQTVTHAFGSAPPNIGVVKVPDPRLDHLAALLKPKRTVAAEVRYVDVAVSPPEFGVAEGMGAQTLAQLSKADALIYVIRVFLDDSVPHIQGSVDPERDLATLDLELAFSDLSVIERRLDRLRTSLKGAKPQEREKVVREQMLLERIAASLGDSVPLREQTLDEHDSKAVESFQFLTAKPALLLFNIGEGQQAEASFLEERFRLKFRRHLSEVAVLCGKLEMELGQLAEDEAGEFRASLGMTSSGLDRVIGLSHRLLGLVSFFTIVSDEVKEWTVAHGTTVHGAAGKIHSDMERGFIRAEVVAYDDLAGCGSPGEARRRGRVRLEGKDYVVQDGDVITILFNL